MGGLVVLKAEDVIESLMAALIKHLTDTFPSQPSDIPLRALKYSPNITLSFVLLNEDASEGSYVRSWDIEAAIRGAIFQRLE